MTHGSRHLGRFHTKVALHTWQVTGGKQHVPHDTVISDPGCTWRESGRSHYVHRMALLEDDETGLSNLVTPIYVTWRNKVDDFGAECEANLSNTLKILIKKTILIIILLGVFILYWGDTISWRGTHDKCDVPHSSCVKGLTCFRMYVFKWRVTWHATGDVPPWGGTYNNKGPSQYLSLASQKENRERQPCAEC